MNFLGQKLKNPKTHIKPQKPTWVGFFFKPGYLPTLQNIRLFSKIQT
jgi:hypothetical protein